MNLQGRQNNVFHESKGLKYRQLTKLMYEVLFLSDPSPIIVFPWSKAILLMREKKNMLLIPEQNKSHVANARIKKHVNDYGTKQKLCC